MRMIPILALGTLLAAQTPQEGLAAKKAGDVGKAVKIFEALAAKGDVRAMVTLGMWYHQGDGVMPDYTRAYDRYLQAAELGDGDAWNNLGVLFRDGLGVKKDPELAYGFFLMVTSQTMGVGGTVGWETENRAAINGNRLFKEFGDAKARQLMEWTPPYLKLCVRARTRVKEVPRECQPMIGAPNLWAIAILDLMGKPKAVGVKLTTTQWNLVEHLLACMPEGAAKADAQVLIRGGEAEATPVLARVLAKPEEAHPVVLTFAGLRRFDQGEIFEGARWAYAGALRLALRIQALNLPNPKLGEGLSGLVIRRFASYTWAQAGRDLPRFGAAMEEMVAWEARTHEAFLDSLAKDPELAGRLKPREAWGVGFGTDILQYVVKQAQEVRTDPEALRKYRASLGLSNEPLTPKP